MSQGNGPSPVSTLAVDEALSSQDDRFVDLVRQVNSPKYLAALADRWKRDPRPWAREQVRKYLSLPMDRPGHHPVVKRLFKQAEADANDELLAHFLVAFDRLVRRVRRLRYQWDRSSRQMWQEEVLATPHDQILSSDAPKAPPPRVPKNGRLFSYATRGYLRRRAWRCFRWMRFQRPADYTQAVANAMALYRDDDFAAGENILDNWSLMNIAFRGSDVLTFSQSRVQLAEGRSLGEMTATPRFEELWKEPEAAAVLFDLLARAARLIRVWAMQLLNQHHAQATQAISAEQLLMLLDHEDDEVQQFGANLLKSMSSADNWTIDIWLRLLETRSVTALVTICDEMGRRVNPTRLDLSQCVALACAKATPVARLGFTWLKQRSIASEPDRAALMQLAEAKCDAVGAELATYALSILASGDTYHTRNVVPFFDSLNAEVRLGAWSWLTPESPGYDDPALWSALVETPYEDVRLQLVDALNQRISVGLSLRERHRLAERDDHLVPVWTAVLLGVHRGNRSKLKALRQISQAIAEHPDKAERMMPVLAVAIRSVRPPEVRAGLSSILSAVAVRPELEAVFAKHIPELRLTPSEAAI